MAQNTATNIDQTYRLTACGVEKRSADMYLEKATIPPIDYYLHAITGGIDAEHWFAWRGNRDIFPAWSLSTLLAFLPTTIEVDNGEFDPIEVFDLLIYPTGNGWKIIYQECKNESYNIHVYTEDTFLIEAAVKMIETLWGNGMRFDKEENKFK